MSRAYNRGPGTVGAVSHSDMVSDISPSILERSRTAEPQARAGSAKGALLRSPKHAARPEAELICACARTVMDPSTSERIKSLVERDLDWEFVIEKAFLHSVLPLLYWNLHITCPKSVPEEVMKRLQLYFREHSCRNLLLASSLLRIIKALETEGIPTIPFKGPILAAFAYKNLSLRAFCDLDILVRQKDVLRAKDLLAAEGYQIQPEFADPRRLARFLPKKKDYKLKQSEIGFTVELHWRLAGARFFSPDIDLLWDRQVEVSFAGSRVRCFQPEDLLLILCVHGSKHLWSRLQWVCDVAELIQADPGIRFDRVLGHAQRLGCERMLLLGLHLAAELLQTALPENLLQKIESDPTIKIIAEEVNARNWSEKYTPITISQMSRLHVMMRERLRDRIRLSYYSAYRQARLAFSPNESDEAFVRLPLYLSFLYYLVRPIRLVKKRGASSLKRFMKHDA